MHSGLSVVGLWVGVMVLILVRPFIYCAADFDREKGLHESLPPFSGD